MRYSSIILSLLIAALIFTPGTGCLIDTDTFSAVEDGDGNKYSIVKIGNQIWIAQNLKTTSYNDGTSIPLVEEKKSWEELKSPGYCWYNNSELDFKHDYGALYNFYALDSAANGGKNVCPEGFRVPSIADWKELGEEAGGLKKAGDMLKESGTVLWWINDRSDNPFRFSARPGGYRSGAGNFENIQQTASWWASTSTTAAAATLISLSANYTDLFISEPNMSKAIGASVRCVKNSD